MKTNAAGIALIKRHERMMLVAYPDPASPRAAYRQQTGRDNPALSGEPWTIGYGHTGGVKPGDSITEARAEDLLSADVTTAEAEVTQATRGVTLNENQFSALVSFVFNVGPAAFGRSTLLRLVLAERWQGAALEFDRWVWAGGKVLQELVNRRREERELFLRPVASTEAVA